jgi:hypothetical protein
MKTLILTGVIAIGSLVAQADPAPKFNTLTTRAAETLKALYSKAQNVTWRPTFNSMVRATFDMYGETYYAFFNDKGEYVATTQDVDLQDFPLKLRMAIDKKMDGQPISSTFELNSDEEHAWYFESRNKKGKMQIWKGFESGRIEEVYVD